MRRAILYASPNHNVFIIDLPASIASAQCSHYRLLSSEPLQNPYPSLEPKTVMARARVASRKRGGQREGQREGQRGGRSPAGDGDGDGEVFDCEGISDEARDVEYVGLIRKALDEVKDADVEKFCGLRCIAEVFVRPGKRRKAEARGGGRGEAMVQSAAARVTGVPATQVTEEYVDGMLQRLAYSKDDSLLKRSTWSVDEGLCDSPAAPSSCDPDLTLVHNNSARTRILSIPTSGSSPQSSVEFYIPPYSAALNAPIASTPPTLTALSTFLAQSSSEKPSQKFSLILLDPPWPNRSARRSASYSTFDTRAETLDDLQDLLASLPLPDFLADNGYITIWITNRSSVRGAAMELLDAWGVQLTEEWIWVKTMERGEPVSELEGVLRKPWEVLLVARRKAVADIDKRAQTLRRRVIFGVPDLHSRKPCLKDLFEELLLSKSAEHAESTSAAGSSLVLELFARYLVNGWFSWGDEALKYQWSGAWVP